jgi:hypothetical protein
MTKIYKVKRSSTPPVVNAWFYRNYPGCTFNFYWYFGNENNMQDVRIYGCEVMKDGKLYSNALQASINWFKTAPELEDIPR